MSKPQKIVTIALWILAVGGMVGVVAMKTQAPSGVAGPTTAPSAEAVVDSSGTVVARVMSDAGESADSGLQVLYPAPSFTLTDQDGKPATNTQLLGKPWVADFFFTTCGTLCPLMSAQMQELQGRLPKDVRLVSFSVDPAHDTPAVLKPYAAQFHAEDGRWFFLTGDEKSLEDVARAMKVGLTPAVGSTPLQHDSHFLLVDGMGKVRKMYDSLSPGDVNDLVTDANSLVSGAADSSGRNAAGVAQ